MLLALTGPVWGFLGTLAGVFGGGLVTTFVAIYNKRHDDPHVEAQDELAGLRASVDALLPSMAELRLQWAASEVKHESELKASELKHEECLRALAEKAGQITNLSLELLRFHRLLEGKSDRPSNEGGAI